MKIHSNLHAGVTFEECNARRNAMKLAAQTGNCAALNWQPSYGTQLPSYPPQQPVYPSYPPVYYPPSQPPAGGGTYGGVYYTDRSGSCG